MFYKKMLEETVTFEVPAQLKNQTFSMVSALSSVIQFSTAGDSVQFRSRVRASSQLNDHGGTDFRVSVERYVYWPVDIWPTIFFLVDPKRRMLAKKPLNVEKLKALALEFIKAEQNLSPFIPEGEFCLPKRVAKAAKKAKCQKLLALINDPY